ncbi:pseudaminic acid cytidylyltransferase [Endozoicomonas sp. SM1973]|uniref:Pseudaminic acid cytidylyltransferase n=1 Tax=Spartinivicinus marinus TaxID=2994442 RepID=A0A853I0V4_9GAMM|nr:pseudaminic acid cytidylyltransferase [Spartinivicinus marinus]MCX4028797.1 pseudaminic acid cytidylyltransferase [Spartinivicinus marinus]NYZ67610.1 pseudaminic acid cytidylyltransferase [Spartinivicinus marinus]
MNIAIIPARGGSKRIKNKNIKIFCGKPIIAYSIEAAQVSNCFEKVIVSTDSEEIANVARAAGAEIPFTRPDYISDDYADTISVIKHAVEFYKEKNQFFDNVCCIYATAPFVTGDIIYKGLINLKNSNSDYAITVTDFSFPIQRAIKITEQGRIKMIQPDHYQTRSQDLIKTYHDAGQLYWGKSNAFLEKKPIFSESTVPIILPRNQVQDIDTEDDWIEAEFKYKLINDL